MNRTEIFQDPDISIENHRKLVENATRDLLIKNNLKAILAVSGGADDLPEEQMEHLANTVKDLIVHAKDLPIAILTGGTNSGVPEVGITVARSLSIPTIGVFPPGGRQYALLEDLDLAIETFPPSIGKAGFGTETPSFVNLAHGIAIVNGSFGTMTEVVTAFKVNKSRYTKGQEPIYVCPIQGTGGVADIISGAIQTMDDYEKVKGCLPEYKVTNGIEAANFFRAKLSFGE